jgi:hypothetical protein
MLKSWHWISSTSGGRSVGIIRLRAKGHGVCLFFAWCPFVRLIAHEAVTYKLKICFATVGEPDTATAVRCVYIANGSWRSGYCDCGLLCQKHEDWGDAEFERSKYQPQATVGTMREVSYTRTIHKSHKTKTISVALSPQANYTDCSTATYRRNLVPTFVDRGVLHVQRGGSPTVVNLSFLERSRYFSFK